MSVLLALITLVSVFLGFVLGKNVWMVLGLVGVILLLAASMSEGTDTRREHI